MTVPYRLEDRNKEVCCTMNPGRRHAKTQLPQNEPHDWLREGLQRIWLLLVLTGTPFRFKRFQPLCISWTDQTPVHDAMLEGNTSSRIEEAVTWKTRIEHLFCFSFSTQVLESASIESGLQLQVWASSTVQFWLQFTFHPTNSSFSKHKTLHSPRESAHKPPIFYLCFWDMLATDKLCNQAVHILHCQH